MLNRVNAHACRSFELDISGEAAGVCRYAGVGSADAGNAFASSNHADEFLSDGAVDDADAAGTGAFGTARHAAR